MCTGAEALMMGGTVLSGMSRNAQGQGQQYLAEADALYELDAAQQQAEKIQRAARRQKSSARAATAASGARVDEFALAAETEIDALANEDAAMTILSGERRARSLRASGQAARAAGRNEMMGSLFQAGGQAYSNWKGAKQAPASSFHSADWWRGGAGWEGE